VPDEIELVGIWRVRRNIELVGQRGDRVLPASTDRIRGDVCRLLAKVDFTIMH
jgi:hypothetical protein